MEHKFSKNRSSLIARETPNSALYRRKFSFPVVFLRPFALLSIFFLALACGPPEDIGLGPNLPKEVSSLSAEKQKELAELLQAGGLHETERNRFVKLVARPEGDLSPAEQDELDDFVARINSALSDKDEQELKKLEAELKSLESGAAESAGANRAPSIASVTAAGGATSIKAGETLVYTVSASDPEGDTLSYQWHYRRSGATSWTDFTGNTTATFAPAANWPLGNYEIAVTVSDSEGGTANTKAGPKAVEVRANSAPTASFTGATPTENSRFQLADVNAQTPALGFFVTATDPEGDALSYKWYEGSTKINGAEQSSLLDRRFYSPVRGKSDSEIEAMAANERHNVLVRADVGDGQNTVSVTRTLRLNIAPAIASVTAAGDATYAVRGGSLVYTVSASDKERDTLSYQWHYRRSGATSWTDFPGNTTATFAPAADWELGDYEIAVTVSDSEGGTANTKAGPLAVRADISGATVTVGTNNAFTIKSTTTTTGESQISVKVTVGGKTLRSGVHYTLSIEPSATALSGVSFRIVNLPSVSALMGGSDGTATAGSSANYEVTVTGKGNYTGTVTQTVAISVQ